ncbi:hypothetical protein MMC06_000600 [Schaereria dolodes]|nr:hypothetical protein [Schaereria dolodes]
MPDYDPDQEESEYDSTPPPETEIVASQTLDDPSADTSLVRRSTDSDAPAQYLIMQELSEMERLAGRTVGVNWERKRKEAKHWWRKEERGAHGVRVGFFKLVNAE